MKLSAALRAIAERSSYSSEQERADVLDALDREADRIDGDAPAVNADDVVTLTPNGAAATSSPAKRPAAKKTAPRSARRKPAAPVGG